MYDMNNANYFKPIKAINVSFQVADQIKELIVNGTVKPGDKLPSERELSKLINVGRLSLREGLRILESLGVVETKYGRNSGTYISKFALSGFAEKFVDILRLSDLTFEQLTEARLEVSLINIKYFLERGTREDLEKLEACVHETESLLKAGERTREKNMLFHQLIAHAAKNPIFIFLTESMTHILRQFLSKYDSPPEHSKQILENNKRILKYLEERDLENASQAMVDHLKYLERFMEKRMKMSEKKRSN